MKYQPKKTDENHTEITGALRQLRVTYSNTHEVGYGYPDICCGVRGLSLIGDFDRVEVMKRLEGVKGLTVLQGCNVLLEVKNPNAKRQWRFTKFEKAWHKRWRGQKAVVETIEDVLRLLGKTPNP